MHTGMEEQGAEAVSQSYGVPGVEDSDQFVCCGVGW